MDHDYLVAKDGDEAWALFRRARPVPVDVVISDWLMLGLEGVELCRRVLSWPFSTSG